jgi:hypothetical protein
VLGFLTPEHEAGYVVIHSRVRKCLQELDERPVNREPILL